ncbi:hypothetical protein MX075_05465 [Streptococcus uberis]|nr:hypothetical protein [Streptococcus uberis]MCK1257296.1 hypothetical protein [Streptococcus uberis]MCK1258975.1 hypothetical protein [Streptococcus uberis]
MFKNDSELIEMLDSLEFDYELDSSNPGLRTKVGEFISFDSLSSPSEYYENLSNQNHNINLISKTENDNRTSTEYYPTLSLSKIDNKKFSSRYRLEFAA